MKLAPKSPTKPNIAVESSVKSIRSQQRDKMGMPSPMSLHSLPTFEQRACQAFEEESPQLIVPVALEKAP